MQFLPADTLFGKEIFMEAFLRLEMDRPINREQHYISPGG